ncbi:dTDP-4-dehydrorhamnose reductase [Zunongwangia endophytica]|uniref:dTDP-4-dehydrorhamnose reductase n=1 Tax=Zunongwangia endophytica TaxID=1808945 RepID=A0ABV8HDP4_9FLAO|nr:dTDP-4-dehydrorhamnose reductase [Zunongwangia endophytica]MDN3593915.1 dTDP-4-dehydrorhamnose reductase [Zunongwangia endophytica]
MVSILVTGASGQLGQSIKKISPRFPEFHFHFKDSSELNIGDKKALKTAFENQKIDYCINCAAYTQVDKAESDKEKANLINNEAISILSELCQEFKVTLIHISTDFVFEGTKNIPYTESDQTNPQSIYGKTKLAGEKAIHQNLEQYFIFRTSWLYSEFGHNFMKSMLKYGQEKKQLSVVYDQVGTPTYAVDLAEFILKIISSKSNQYGIYNYSNEGIASWYDFAFNIFRISGIKIDLKPIKSEEYLTPAKRPSYSVLDKTKAKTIFQVEIPHWQDSLAKALQELN